MAGITRKEVFVTSDGEKFDTEAEALIHDQVASMKGPIQDYIKATIPEFLSNKRVNPQRTRAENTIVGWLKYQATQAGVRSTGAEG